jgi:D-alanine-D-alanine ligase
MTKLTVALLAGGNSPEREVSLFGGDQVYEALDDQKYQVLRYDPRDDMAKLVADAGRIDMALNIMHGIYGEDGSIQGFLDLLDIPYQGSGILGSALAMHKVVAKQLYEISELPVPRYVVAHKNQPVDSEACLEQLGLPIVVKPVQGGSSVGMTIVRRTDDLAAACVEGFKWEDTLLLEAYVAGVELTVGVLGNDLLEALPLVEIIPGAGHDFFDYKAKYTPGATSEICPARVDPSVVQTAQSYARTAHRVLHCRDYSRTDMILQGDDLYVLETNTIPGMTQTSLLPQAAQAHGLSFGQLLDQLIKLCMERQAAA